MATTPGVALPGTSVPANAEVSPSGAQGLAGITAGVTTITQTFTVPPVGSTQTVTVTDASSFVVGQIVYMDQAGGGGAGNAGALQITAKVGNTLTLLNPYPTPAIPLADSTQPGLLTEVSGLTTDFIDGTNSTQNLATAVKPIISVVRQRAINVLGNSTFEIDQQRVGASTAMANGARMVDRWLCNKTGSWAANSQQTAGLVPVPGTSSFYITQNFLRITLTTQEATMAAADFMAFYQWLEGPQFREILGDVHSEQLLVRSSVAPLSFCLAWFDGNPPTFGLTTLCTISSANTWTLVQKPNLPVFPSGGHWNCAPGQSSQIFRIILAAGSNFNTTNDGIWIANTTGILVPPGMSNFCASPVNSTFDIAFAQAQPGPECGQLLDLKFTENYDQALRYFSKSYDYATALGTGSAGSFSMFILGTAFTSAAFSMYGTHSFPRPMAKRPTVTVYHHTSGAANSVVLQYASSGTIPNASSNQPVTSVNASLRGIAALVMGTGTSTSPTYCYAEWAADTGW